MSGMFFCIQFRCWMCCWTLAKMVAERDTEVSVHFMSSSRLCKVICTVELRNFSLCGEREGGGQRKGESCRRREREGKRDKQTDRDREKGRETVSK